MANVPQDNTVRVALLVGDLVIDASDDLLAVRTAAALMAGAHRQAEPPVLIPVTDGRRAALRLVAQGRA
ncbi:MAG: hypothetical protein JWM85_1657 [Acidimicrobiaceae bacterium]|nr:hypothetical protein [Acidimicrobiaceae bacterium]